MLLELAVILLLVAINGLFAGAEIAIVGVDRVRLRQLIESGGRRARMIEALRKNPERFLATVQIMITVVGATAGAFGGATFAEDLTPLLTPYLGRYADEAALAVAVGVISYLSLVLGELVPKSLALRHTERYALMIAPLLSGLASAARPLVWLLTKSASLVLPERPPASHLDTRLSPAELRGLVDDATESGTLDERAGEIASRALEFARLTVSQVMIARTRIVGIEQEADLETLRQLVLEHSYSRMPVFKTSMDEICGYVLYKDLLPLAWEGRLLVLRDLVRPPYFVGKTMPAAELLHEMRERHQQLAVVVDEHGGTAGIVTLDDLLDELTGEVLSEIQATRPRSIHPQPDGTVLVRGDVPLHQVNRELELALSGGGQTTLGGLSSFLAGGVPGIGTVLESSDGTKLLVERASTRHVELVRITPAPRATERETVS
ncbi:MAG TPA: hemolysin family protein [Polyangiaceae bacterium]